MTSAEYGAKKRIAIMIAIEAYRDVNGGQCPTFRDIGKAVGYTSTNAEYLLRKLRHEGMVTWKPTANRTLRVTQKGKDYLASLGG